MGLDKAAEVQAEGDSQPSPEKKVPALRLQ